MVDGHQIRIKCEVVIDDKLDSSFECSSFGNAMNQLSIIGENRKLIEKGEEKTHSPLPWHTGGDGCIYDANGIVVCDCYIPARKNAWKRAANATANANLIARLNGGTELGEMVRDVAFDMWRSFDFIKSIEDKERALKTALSCIASWKDRLSNGGGTRQNNR